MSETKIITVVELRPVSPGPGPRTWDSQTLRGILFFAVLISCGLISTYRVETPSTQQRASLTQFSSERAMKHVQAISQKPHPVGSSEHDLVRDYILQTLAQIGLHPQLQKTVGVNLRYHSAGNVENILARLKGTTQEKAVLLAAHYDSFPTSRGASDDGAAVAAMLECAKTLKEAATLRRDIIFLFTDGEEAGLLGSSAFVKEHPWAKDVGLVLNFEARGTTGPSIMFETSDKNGWLINDFAQATSDPVANSVSNEIYKHLPNDTDFTIFKAAGYSGLNFAFINHLVAYHSTLDNPNSLDPGSLQHQGSYLLELARYFGNASIPIGNPKTGNAVYFDFMGGFVHYSSKVALLLLAIAVFCFGIYLLAGIKAQYLSAKKLLRALGVMSTAIAGAILTAWAASAVIAALQPRFVALQSGLLYNSGFYVSAYASAGLASAAAIYGILSKRLDASNLAGGGILGWFFLLCIVSYLWPSASYLLLWPLLATLLAWIAIFRFGNPLTQSANPHKQKSGVLLLIAAVLTAMLIGPLLYKVFTAFAADSVLIVTFGLALMLALFYPALQFKRITGVLGFAGLAFMVMALAGSGYNRRHPRFDSLFQATDANTGKEIWGSFDKSPDPWTSQVFAGQGHLDKLMEIFPANTRGFLQAPSTMPQEQPPALTVLKNLQAGPGRQLTVKVSSQRHAPILWISFDPKALTSRVMVNGREMYSDPGAGRGIIYYGSPTEGIELSFQTDSNYPIRLDVKDVANDLLSRTGSLHSRPEDTVPRAVQFNDSTIIKKTFIL